MRIQSLVARSFLKASVIDGRKATWLRVTFELKSGRYPAYDPAEFEAVVQNATMPQLLA
jgi:hypothetical protein